MPKNEMIYLTFQQIQERIDLLLLQSGQRPTQKNAIMSLYHDGAYLESASNKQLADKLMDKSSEEFLRHKAEIYVEVDIDPFDTANNPFDPEFPDFDEDIVVCLTRRFSNEATPMISHSNFEITYIYNGSFIFRFEHEERIVNEGDVVIVSPRAKHCFTEISYDAFCIQMDVNYKTFNSTFLTLLDNDNVLSNFFKAIMTNKQQTNYLLLSTGDSPQIRSIARKMYLEQYRYDLYSPHCTYNWLRLFFSYVLRSNSDSYQFSVNSMGLDFTPILRYLQKNYLTTSLSELAAEFHYSQSYMSMLIKQITGKTYSNLIRELKISDAKDYLIHSSKSIEATAEISGYKSVDHFSRTFKSVTGMSPQQYRIHMKNEKTNKQSP